MTAAKYIQLQSQDNFFCHYLLKLLDGIILLSTDFLKDHWKLSLQDGKNESALSLRRKGSVILLIYRN